ncbi:hypothetical protein GJ744_006088 [Endocarpon pusillum]|uniref:Uncharacterized protein n=1 Tax=Endocarpon pusillum TaxID=364733 RepID=A0A8H7AMF2_9EURO|nr:hypothetical protein GJ744_006088 [Endocarpon pusillum]
MNNTAYHTSPLMITTLNNATYHTSPPFKENHWSRSLQSSKPSALESWIADAVLYTILFYVFQ